MKTKLKKIINAKCTCCPCPSGRDDMYWREDEEMACERRAQERNKGKVVFVKHN